ncbi:ABC transporter permease [Schlegelella sp. S2-27]|uniref:ABC transporter permease n=1 Tax=Caldimonas mangrovi TaxID=2944811 RepID=A0ABT0YNU5_9BURK|nr:ABC transporter permease [Caldimonas mangrovi]MCM5679548.1 ABC transporter permease [Caldimonas mangrovi]
MNSFLEAFGSTLRLLVTLDPQLLQIAGLSLSVSAMATLIGASAGLLLGAWIAVSSFPGRRALLVVLNTLLALPSVVVGLVIYLLLSRAGPLGTLGILFTPSAMVIAQTVLVLPIVTALSRQAIEDAMRDHGEQLRSLGAGRLGCALTLLWDERMALLTLALAAFGRAVSEVGAVMIVGGNIDGVTRVMTTAIALETSKGDLPLALALGVVLLSIVLVLNVLIAVLRGWRARTDEAYA